MTKVCWSKAPNGIGMIIPKLKRPLVEPHPYRKVVQPTEDSKISRILKQALVENQQAMGWLIRDYDVSQKVIEKSIVGYVDRSVLKTLLTDVDATYQTERGILLEEPSGVLIDNPLFMQPAFTYEYFLEGDSSHFDIRRIQGNGNILHQDIGHRLDTSFLNGDYVTALAGMPELAKTVFVCRNADIATAVSSKFNTPSVISPMIPLDDYAAGVVTALVNSGYRVVFLYDSRPAFAEMITAIGPGLGLPRDLRFICTVSRDAFFSTLRNCATLEALDSKLTRVTVDEFSGAAKTIKTHVCESIHSTQKLKIVKDDISMLYEYETDARVFCTDYVEVHQIELTKEEKEKGENPKSGFTFFHERLTNFFGECIEVVNYFVTEMGKLIPTADYTFRFERNGQSVIQRVKKEELYKKPSFQAILDNCNIKASFDSNRYDDVRTAVLNACPDKRTLDYTEKLGWDRDGSQYNSIGFKISSTGELEYKPENNIPANLNIPTSSKRVHVPANEDEEAELLSVVYGPLLNVHLTWIVLCALACVTMSWFRTPIWKRILKWLTLLLIGHTSGGKTILARAANGFDGDPLVHQSFVSTSNSIHRDAFMQKDHLTYIDDFKTENMSAETEKGWQCILQAAYDGMGRDRLTDTQKMDMHTTVMVTGESSIKGSASVAGRCFEISVPQYDELKDGVDRAGHFETVTKWLGRLSAMKPLLMVHILIVFGIDRLCEMIETAAKAFAQDMPRHSNLDRVAHSAAILETGATVFLDFGVSSGALDKRAAEAMVADLHCNLKQLILKQLADVKSLTLADQYMRGLRSLLASRKYRLVKDGDTADDANQTSLGRYDDQFVYIFPEMSVAEVVKLYASDAVRLNTKNVHQSLVENRYLGEKHKEKQFDKKRASYWWFQREHFDDIIGDKQATAPVYSLVQELAIALDQDDGNDVNWETKATLKQSLVKYQEEKFAAIKTFLKI